MMKTESSTSKKIQKEDAFSVSCSSVFHWIISVGLFVILGLFPLYMRDGYFDILNSKYMCYYVTVIAMTAASVLAALIMIFIDFKEYHGAHTRKILAALKPSHWKQTFCTTDIAVLIYWLVCLLSTIRSDFVYESFWGNEGRYSGLFLITLYVAAYFMISRLWKTGSYQYQIFVVSAIILCLLGITDYFQMDLIELHRYVNIYQVTMFTSTLGNINSYVAYVSIYMGFVSMMYATAAGKKQMVWYYLNMVISFFAIIMGRSDSAYLAIAALYGLSPFVLFRTREGTQRYLVMLATMFSVIAAIRIVSERYAYCVADYSGPARIVGELKLLPVVIAVLWAAAAGYYYAFIKKRKLLHGSSLTADGYDRTNSRIRIAIWAVVCLLAVFGTVMIFWIVNGAGMDPERLGSLKNYLVLDDMWGTKRGYIWRKSVELFADFSVEKKLIGYGPDTFGILTVLGFRNEMASATGFVFDSAHNEYLQYLITIGILGTGAYITGLAAAAVRLFRNLSKTPYAAGVMFAIVCYALQAFVNLNLPVVTPMLWTLMSMGMAECRRAD